jgi:hypothetical protein
MGQHDEIAIFGSQTTAIATCYFDPGFVDDGLTVNHREAIRI